VLGLSFHLMLLFVLMGLPQAMVKQEPKKKTAEPLRPESKSSPGQVAKELKRGWHSHQARRRNDHAAAAAPW